METNPQNTEPVAETKATEIVINEQKLKDYIDYLKLDQNLSLGVVAGLAAAVISAVVWATITVSTGYQIGYMAIGVGLLVGFTIRKVGKGFDKIFGIAGAALSVFGCLLGNYLSMVAFISRGEDIEFFQLLTQIQTSMIPDIMAAGFSPIDLLFYGFAIYYGYKLSFRTLTEQEIMQNAVDKN